MHLAVKIFRDVVKKLIIYVKEWNRYRAANVQIEKIFTALCSCVSNEEKCAVIYSWHMTCSFDVR